MRLADRIRRMIEGMPPGASVTLPVSAMEEWLDDGAPDVEPDLTVQEVAELYSRSPQTVRTWICEGRLVAYPFSGREYRITKRALEEFQARERARGKGSA